MAVFEDSCTDTNGTQWQSHTPGTGTITRLWGSNATVDIVINSNQVNPETDADDGVMYTLNGTYPSADYKMTATRVATAVAARPTYMLLRVQDQENMYALRLGGAGAGEAQLYKKVAGTWSTIGTAFDAPAAGSVVEFEIIGSTLKVHDDSTQIASETDTAISAAGTAGFAAGGGAELVTSTDDSHSVNVWDAFLVEDLGVGGDPEGPLVGGKLIGGGLLIKGRLVR